MILISYDGEQRMCTSFAVNRKKTLIGWNLDLLDMTHRVRPTVSPFKGDAEIHPWMGWDRWHTAEAMLRQATDDFGVDDCFAVLRAVAEKRPVCSEPGVTFMGALSDAEGNVLHIVPGQGCLYYEKPAYRVLTNFSPFKGDAERHPWMGWDRWHTAEAMLRQASDDFGVEDCFAVLRAVSQTVCPTVVSMVFDVQERTVCWCENRKWDAVETMKLKPVPSDGTP